jgi:F-type H+-transporting ATPase subunit gamma
MAGISSKEIKNRIRSMESTKQITKAMEMVAVSKLRRAQNRVASSRPYFEIFEAAIQEVVNTGRDLNSPYLVQKEGNQSLHIVIAGDRGLAGGYNSNVIKQALSKMEGQEVTILPIGKKAVDYFQGHGYHLLSRELNEVEDVTVGDCFTIAKDLCSRYRAGEFQTLYITFTGFVSMLSQVPESRQMLPLSKKAQEDKKAAGADLVYEPDCEEVFASIVPEYLGGILYGAICESRAAEQAARRTAMEAATSNAQEMIEDLSLKYNRARQAAITQEITEIVAGS